MAVTRVAPGDQLTAPSPPVGSIRELNFRPDIEGLRAVAVIAVLLYHASVPPRSGWIRRCRRLLRHLRFSHHPDTDQGAAPDGPAEFHRLLRRPGPPHPAGCGPRLGLRGGRQRPPLSATACRRHRDRRARRCAIPRQLALCRAADQLHARRGRAQPAAQLLGVERRRTVLRGLAPRALRSGLGSKAAARLACCCHLRGDGCVGRRVVRPLYALDDFRRVPRLPVIALTGMGVRFGGGRSRWAYRSSVV